MTAPKSSAPLHEDLVAQPSHQAPTTNPFAQSANILVSVPENVEVRLVDASALGDYEIWSLISSILSSAVIGFGVAYFQAPDSEKGSYLAIEIVWLSLLVICAITAIVKRRKLTAKTRRIRFRVGDAIPEDVSRGS